MSFARPSGYSLQAGLVICWEKAVHDFLEDGTNFSQDQNGIYKNLDRKGTGGGAPSNGPGPYVNDIRILHLVTASPLTFLPVRS